MSFYLLILFSVAILGAALATLRYLRYRRKMVTIEVMHDGQSYEISGSSFKEVISATKAELRLPSFRQAHVLLLRQYYAILPQLRRQAKSDSCVYLEFLNLSGEAELLTAANEKLWEAVSQLLDKTTVSSNTLEEVKELAQKAAEPEIVEKIDALLGKKIDVGPEDPNSGGSDDGISIS